MKGLLRIIVFLCLNSLVISLKKCCPKSEEVEYKKHKQPQFNCVNLSIKQLNDDKIQESDRRKISSNSDQLQFMGINVLIDNASHWPSCVVTNLSYAFLKEEIKFFPTTSCADIMNNEYFLFTCDKRLIPSGLESIFKVRKCCQKNFSYDVYNRQCVDNNQTLPERDTVNEIFGVERVLFEHGLPDCKATDVIVEFHSNLHSFHFENGTMQIISNFSETAIVPNESYCIERTSNLTESEVDIEELQLKISSKWIIKACHNKSVCEEIPCVRKCCKEGERTNYEENKCESFESHLDLAFYTFTFNEVGDSLEQMEPKGIVDVFYRNKS